MTGTPDSRPVVILADGDEAITSNLAAFLNPAGFTRAELRRARPRRLPAPGSGWRWSASSWPATKARPRSAAGTARARSSASGSRLRAVPRPHRMSQGCDNDAIPPARRLASFSPGSTRTEREELPR
jgi:hypothetical protein